jgi:hypothetical protein
MTELAERTDAQPLVARPPAVNAHPPLKRPELFDSFEAARRAIASLTAGASLAVAERPDGWLSGYYDPALFRPGDEWALKGFDLQQEPDSSVMPARYYMTVDIGSGGLDVKSVWGDIFGVSNDASTAYVEQALAPDARFIAGGFPAGSTQFYGAPYLQPTFRPVNVSPLQRLSDARRVERDARRRALETLESRLDSVASRYAQMSPKSVVEHVIDDLGVGQLLTARAVGVTPTAVRKWRRGETARTEHRTRLSRFAALSDVLGDLGPHDPAGWLDIPLSTSSTLTPMDLFLAGRADLVLLLAAGGSDPRETLDAFDADWRTRYPADREYEIVTLSDGSQSALPRRQG